VKTLTSLMNAFPRRPNYQIGITSDAGQQQLGFPGDTAGNAPAVIAKSQPVSTGYAIGVLGAKGGCGTTTVALNLTAAISRNASCSLIDANLQNPDSAVFLGRQSKYSLVDLIERHRELNAALFEACSSSLCEQSRFFCGPPDGSGARSTNLTRLAECLDSLRKLGGFYVLDLPGHLDKHLVTMLDRVDLILLTFEATISSVACVRRWVNIFAELGYGQEKYKLVLNRAGSRLRAVQNDLPVLLGRPFIGLPNAFMLLQDSATDGVPGVMRRPRDKFAIAINQLANLVMELHAGNSKAQSSD
jgi:pilus assembly protein CpaE